jgi:hypothetical protein
MTPNRSKKPEPPPQERSSIGALALALLLGSLVLNAYLLATRSPAAKAPRPASSASAAVATAPPPEPGTCEKRLEACEAKAWAQLRKAIAADHPQPPPVPAPPVGTERPKSGATEQEAALCAKAQGALRLMWRVDRDRIAADLTKSLGDPAEQARNIASESDRMKVVAGLDDREATAVASAYKEQRLARIAEARTALGRDPPDFTAMLDSARALYADEDAILARIAGQPAQEAWRGDQLEGRTVLMAIAAAMADKDWDQSIRW